MDYCGLENLKFYYDPPMKWVWKSNRFGIIWTVGITIQDIQSLP